MVRSCCFSKSHVIGIRIKKNQKPDNKLIKNNFNYEMDMKVIQN